MSRLKIFLSLIKIKITFAVTLTTMLGYVMYAGNFSVKMLLPIFGLFLIAAASAALNQFQEIEIDKKMDRTANRPLPSGQLSPRSALLIILLLVFSGSVILYLSAGFLSLQIGILALIWYNGIYTPLKRKTAFAVVPGSVIGALPPLVGWVAAGGSITNPEIIIISFFMFMWQIPHFWLLVIKHGNEYSKAGLPTLTDMYSTELLKKITFLWTLATAVSAMFLPMYHAVSNRFMSAFVVLASLWLIVSFRRLFFTDEEKYFAVKKYFIFINVFLLLIIIGISVDSIL